MKPITKAFKILNISPFRIYYPIILTFIISLFDVASVLIFLTFIRLLMDVRLPEFFYSIEIFDFILQSDKKLLIAAFILLAIMALKYLTNLYLNYKIFGFIFEALHELRVRLMKSSLMKLKIEFQLSEHINDILSTSERFIFDYVLISIKRASDSIILMVLVVTAVGVNPILIVSFIVLIIIAILIYDYILKNILIDLGRQINVSRSSMTALVDESLRARFELWLLRGESFAISKFSAASRVYSQSSIRSQFITTSPKHTIEFITITTLVLFILFQIKSGNGSNELLSEIATLSLIIFRLVPILYSIAQSGAYTRGAVDSVNRMYDAACLESSIVDIASPIPIRSDFSSIRLNGLNFSYKGLRIFNDTSFHVKSGDFIVIMAPSGSGKSTLFDLLIGILSADSATYQVDGVDYSFSTYRSKIRDLVSFVPQVPLMLNGSLEENVRLGNDTDTGVDLEALFMSFGLSDLYAHRSGKLQIEYGGVNRSGGERQRIAIARAVYHSKAILILDEPTAAMDSATSKIVLDSLKDLNRRFGTTIIMSSHNDFATQYASRCITFKNKKILEN